MPKGKCRPFGNCRKNGILIQASTFVTVKCSCAECVDPLWLAFARTLLPLTVGKRTAFLRQSTATQSAPRRYRAARQARPAPSSLPPYC